MTVFLYFLHNSSDVHVGERLTVSQLKSDHIFIPKLPLGGTVLKTNFEKRIFVDIHFVQSVLWFVKGHAQVFVVHLL